PPLARRARGWGGGFVPDGFEESVEALVLLLPVDLSLGGFFVVVMLEGAVRSLQAAPAVA
ncbi:hypothetical protein, partial [Streptomyces sp. MBT72]|uniref:hypothetical protein n=1 Tax=Streptomyces sp. MBT72 TaxID=1488402 RepID=UPI001F430B8F